MIELTDSSSKLKIQPEQSDDADSFVVPKKKVNAKNTLTNTTTQLESNLKFAPIFYAPPPLPRNRPTLPGNPSLIRSKSLPNSRPILVGAKKVTSLDHLPLHRPVFHSDLNIVAMHGDRPVLRLDSALVPSPSLPNNRPIAIERPSQSGKLMGYID